jgi:glycosyltransferase involved in cell wall biosynthesis
MLTVGFISQDWSKVGETHFPNGCTWYRCILPAYALQQKGHKSNVGFLTTSSDGRVGVVEPTKKAFIGHNIIVFKLPMHISNLRAAESAKKHGQKVVVDIDDWFDNLPETNRAKQTTDPEKNPENNRDIYFSIIEMADALICSTDFLFDFYSKKHPEKPIFLVRNSIDLKRWKIRKKPSFPPTIGWVGATPWRSMDLEQLAPFMDSYMLSRGLSFHHAGNIQNADSAASLLGLSSVNITHEGMKPMTQLPELFKNIDIGIVPLNNIKFNYAKSYLKGLEYAAAGVPFVASWSPEYQLLADSGVGRIATNKEEWEYHLDELLDFGMWKDESELNRQILEENFTIEKRAPEWESVYTKIMDIN